MSLENEPIAGTLIPARPTNRPANLYPRSVVIDPNVDNVWGSTYVGKPVSGPTNPYFDYFFTGQDIVVMIDGTEDVGLRSLPILGMGFNVTQQKAPVYGFWSYTYDAVLRGTRIIQGTITLATKSPNYLKNLLAKAAQSRQERLGSTYYNYNKGLTEDDTNIEKFWGTTIDPALNSIGTSLYSVHPPFSFVILYGVESTAVTSWSGGEQMAQFMNDNPYYTDTNQRLVESDPADQTGRIVLDACEIQSMETSYDPDGKIIAETYSFFARDIITN